MLFIETSIFTKQIKELVTDEEYRQLQQDLLIQPDKGDLIKNGGGIRKVRCAQGALLHKPICKGFFSDIIFK
ncbi:hypothetical protein D3X48_18955 [Acinetobacter baumannii]|uniref:hypothetical protein n=1 Tax=Acinetobacter baumannii TaxID=470 RepID=UPI000E736BFD|nr:hypothetical protein [Acinetobacter baumannii]RJO31114.1 hypothetical protein D3X48_18955 [Acinetobacter baumannii]RJO45963.1 hypothetical protein D3X42_17105 [Acinetobacter baumannii]